MTRVRAVLIVILVLAMLPWRAHLSVGMVGVPMASATVLEPVSQDADLAVAAVGPAAKAFPVPPPCPGPKLPGSACSSPVAILPGETVLPSPPGRGTHLAEDTSRDDLWQPDGPSDPPRPC